MRFIIKLNCIKYVNKNIFLIMGLTHDNLIIKLEYILYIYMVHTLVNKP